MKIKLILLLVKIVMVLIGLGIGIWYLSSSLGGSAITYTSMDGFLTSIGAADGDIANANGCFLCGYVADMFGVIGRATEMFWTAIVNGLWILMAVGFGVWLFIYTGMQLYDAMKKTAELDGKEKKLDFKTWFDKVWRQGARIMFAGVFLGVLGMGGTSALKTVANITITPVMYIGTELSMAATGISDSATCGSGALANMDRSDDILNPILQPFMCVMGNLNSVMLAGAAGGFAMMNYSWMGLGGGLFTWLAGLALVIMFLIIGFNLFFQVLSVIFKLVFIIIFMPLFIAAAAFEQVWKVAENLFNKAIGMVAGAAIEIIRISLKIIIIYATVSFVADEYFPGPVDGYSAMLPPILGTEIENPDAQTLAVMNVFSECERVSLVDGVVDGGKFKDCFITRKAVIESKYPDAFGFMDDGWSFLMMMMGLFFIYYYVVAPRVEKILGDKRIKSDFDIGANLKQLGKNIWNIPVDITKKVTKAIGEK